MSISTNIDGSAGSSGQLFDLLTVVANPAAYQEKIKALEDATAQNKKFVELVGPASDILSLKEKAQADAQAAAAVLDTAHAKAQDIVAQAESQAAAIFREAESRAQNMKAEADGLLAQARVAKKNAESVESAATAGIEAAKQLKEEAAQAKADAEKAVADAQAAKAEAVAAKAEIIAKHQEFIRTL